MMQSALQQMRTSFVWPMPQAPRKVPSTRGTKLWSCDRTLNTRSLSQPVECSHILLTAHALMYALLHLGNEYERHMEQRIAVAGTHLVNRT